MDRIEALEASCIDKQRQQNTKSVFDLASRLYGKCGWNLRNSNLSLVKGSFYISSLGIQSSKFITLIFASFPSISIYFV